MHRTSIGRTFAVLVAVWFGIVANQQMAFGVCQMAKGHATAHTTSAHSMGGMMAMPMDDDAPSAPANAPAPHAPQPVPQDCCSCIAACHGLAAVPVAADIAWLDATPALRNASFDEGATLAASATGVVLPFANGPPGAVDAV